MSLDHEAANRVIDSARYRDLGVLLEQGALLRARHAGTGRSALHNLSQAGQPVRPARRTGHGTVNQGSTRDKGIN